MIIVDKLTKDTILEKFNQIDIFATYLSISRESIEECIEFKSYINSPIREDDEHPSAGFKFNNKGKLKFRDFGGYFWGDCFDLVAYLKRLNVNNKEHFMIILKDIYATMIHKPETHIKKLIAEVKADKHIFEIAIRDWENVDNSFWQPIIYGSDYRRFLNDRYVYPINYLWIDRVSQPYPKYEHSRANPAYAYYLFKNSQGIDDYKIYYPKGRPKFRTNNNKYLGFHLLPKRWDILIITKSYKDVLSMLSFIEAIDTDLVIAVIAVPFEQYRIKQEEYDYFAKHTNLSFSNGVKAIMSVYDLDYAGLNGSGYLKRKFDIPRFMFKQFDKKDFTDNVEYYGKDVFYQHVIEFVEYLENII